MGHWRVVWPYLITCYVMGHWRVAGPRVFPRFSAASVPPCTLHPTHYLSTAPYTLHPTPCTLHPAPCTQLPAPYTPTPYTLHPTPYILHPTPHTLRPTPYTLLSQSRAGWGWRSHSPPTSGSVFVNDLFTHPINAIPYLFPSKYGTYKTVKARFRPWLSGKSPQTLEVVPSSLGSGP